MQLNSDLALVKSLGFAILVLMKRLDEDELRITDEEYAEVRDKKLHTHVDPDTMQLILKVVE